MKSEQKYTEVFTKNSCYVAFIKVFEVIDEVIIHGEVEKEGILS